MNADDHTIAVLAKDFPEAFPPPKKTPVKYHYMIDIETMGLSATAPIISIGAVKFDPEESWDQHPMEAFSVNVDIATVHHVGCAFEGETIKWWLAPERAAAREELLKGHGVDLRDALDGLKDWLGEGGPTWANSPSFDLAILARAFKFMGTEVPWKYTDERDYRTVRKMSPTRYVDMADEEIKISLPNLVGHSARDDAEYQARALIYICDIQGLDIK